MKNVERFNLYTAFLFGHFYDQFPIARAIDVATVVSAVRLPEQEVPDPQAAERSLVAQTLEWLVETGYLIQARPGREPVRIGAEGFRGAQCQDERARGQARGH